ncbi:unnamed protein product [Phytophthora fragariaefolia]|uniref:diacylglycerol O-acyltransferase n=1 Tax=Phytophthora fragariaefolia TaxID=1490495 RepID=A0A9W6Y5V8_9STRA|nr:unnamed protein product [Phytophthora fragariaefolia]
MVEENDASPFVKPNDSGMFAFRPHGVLSNGWAFNGAHHMSFEQADCRWLVAENPFWFPVMRDLLNWMDFNSVAKATFHRFMPTRQNVCLIPGGFEEATLYDRGKHRVPNSARKTYRYCGNKLKLPGWPYQRAEKLQGLLRCWDDRAIHAVQTRQLRDRGDHPSQCFRSPTGLKGPRSVVCNGRNTVRYRTSQSSVRSSRSSSRQPKSVVSCTDTFGAVTRSSYPVNGSNPVSSTKYDPSAPSICISPVHFWPCSARTRQCADWDHVGRDQVLLDLHSRRAKSGPRSSLRQVPLSFDKVHRGKSDLPEVVLARCKFLLGLGKGDFNIFTQNCEHAAHWCKTGQQWSKQTLTLVRGRVPFEKRLAKEDVDALEKEIDEIKAVSRTVVNNVLRLSGSKVYLRVHGNKYARIMDDGVHVDVVPQGGNPDTCGRTAFRLECYSKQYNCVKVAFYHEESGRYMFSRSTFSCFRDLRMKKANCLRGTSGMRWEYSSGGHLNSMNQHRRYIGTRDDGLLVDVSLRGDASYFEFVPCVAKKAKANGQTGSYVPPDITLITRAYNHAKSVEETRSMSMLEFEEEQRSLPEITHL